MNKKRVRNDIKLNNFVLVFTLFLFALLLIRCGYLALSDEVDGINLQNFASKRTTKKEIITAKSE